MKPLLRIFLPGIHRIPLMVIALTLLFPVEHLAAEGKTAADPALVEQVKAQVMQELRQSDFLKQEIEAGIEAYIAREREARAQAQAQAQEAQEQARLEQERQQQENLKLIRRYTEGQDHRYGAPDAPVSLIEYSDFECPFCKRFHATAKALVDQSNGQINWIYRHYPLSFHNPGAQKQAEASECAFEQGGDAAFWRYTDAIYERTRSGGRGFALDQLAPLAVEQGLDGEALQTCVDSNKYAARVQADMAEGAKVGITGTPGNVLLHNDSGEVRLMVGAHPLPAVQAAANELLNSAEAQAAAPTTKPQSEEKL